MKFLVLLLLFINSCTCQKQSDTKASQETLNAKGKTMVIIETKHGNIEIELYPEDAPKTVAQIQDLVGKGFYNGLIFHRVIPGFVAQGGDPLGNGTGGSGKNVVAEFNARKHLEGTVAMARSQDPNSADSQFYICLAPQPYLDRQYTVFGQVKKGMDAVHKIKQGDKMDKVYLK
jgi:cyclophilin family peptidyl-prolyl cis-trans isomerase